MHTCIHAYMHTCIHAYMHTCIHAYMHTCIHAYMHTACMHPFVPPSIQTDIQTYRLTDWLADIHTYICIYMHVYHIILLLLFESEISLPTIFGRQRYPLVNGVVTTSIRWVNTKEHQTCAAMDLRFWHTLAQTYLSELLMWNASNVQKHLI